MALPAPESGLVISYSYLWRRERDAGQNEGLKDRPCAIVLTVAGAAGDRVTVTVAPITHTAPRDPNLAVEIPPKVKRHLGLDDGRSWIVLEEFNEFVWPGFDLRPLPDKRSGYAYGRLPPALFTRIVQRALELRRAGTAVSLSRERDKPGSLVKCAGRRSRQRLIYSIEPEARRMRSSFRLRGRQRAIHGKRR